MSRFIIAGLFLGLCTGVSFSSSESDALLNKLVEKGYLTSSESQEIRNEIASFKQEEHKRKKEEEDKKKEREKFQMKITGYTQITYKMDKTLGVSERETFRIERSRLSFDRRINEWLSFRVQPEFAGISRGRNVAFRDVWIELVAHKDLARFRFGQHHQPFGFENIYSSARKKVADTPFYIKDVLISDYDYGIQWWGNLPGANRNLLSWRVACMNGTTEGIENNLRKDWAGRVLVNPMNEVELGLSYYYRVFPSSAVSHYGAHIKTETNSPFPTFLTLEYVGGKNSTGISDVLNAIATLEVKPLVGIGILSELAPVVRYEYWDPNINTLNNENINVTVGLNFYPDKSLRILADYVMKSEKPREIDNNRLNLMLQVSY